MLERGQGLTDSRYCLMVVWFEQRMRPLGGLKSREFLDQLRDCQIFKRETFLNDSVYDSAYDSDDKYKLHSLKLFYCFVFDCAVKIITSVFNFPRLIILRGQVSRPYKTSTNTIRLLFKYFNISERETRYRS
jgi:hypothetical protein